MQIQLDVREHELCKSVAHWLATTPLFQGIEMRSVALPLGDIVVSKDGVDQVVVERKTWADLAASFQDGRYAEQSHRLSGSAHPNHHIVYLLEGDLTPPQSFLHRGAHHKAQQDKKKLSLLSAMVSLNFFKGFSVMQSAGVDESAYLLCILAYKIAIEPGRAGYYLRAKGRQDTATLAAVQDDREDEDKEDKEDKEVQEDADAAENETAEEAYCHAVAKVKKDNVTPENIGAIMLSQIPGISSLAAVEIMKHYASLADLVNALQADPACVEKLGLTIPLVGSKDPAALAAGKRQRMRKAVYASLRTYLLKAPTGGSSSG